MPNPLDVLPVADGVGLPWDVAVDDAVGAIAAARERCGDTFVVESGGDRYLFTFSPTGVESFYALAEEAASKGVADFLMLRRKLPDEVFAGRRLLPSSLFRRDDVTSYLANLDRALDATEVELGESGSVDLFALTRRLGHRMGLASWAGPGCADGEAFEALVRAFDVLDGSDAFVHPDAMAAVAASGMRAERAALAEISEIMEVSLRQHDSTPEVGDGLFSRIVDAWASEPPDVRKRGIAMDVALIHIASMSNLMAALGWALVDLIVHPEHLRLVAAGDRDLATSCALESTRLAQRSIMSRAVLEPVAFDTGAGVVDVPKGWTIATLLPLLNTSAAAGLENWDPSRWHRHRLADSSALPSPMLVTAFGHGRHSCPAQPFSLAAMTMAMTRLVGRYDMKPEWSDYPRPVPAQIGGVARAADPCPVGYTTR
ncbi:cytochrome P450 [Mycolicibacterium sp. BK556]|uniref:cytochrome n=1 Tax=unclassified Mycolicibacterium TaxID=2636767 RepID=UPI00160A8915|nr:cytochrome P450 [Mycolicibacterium sp. BK556]MBB3634706.1 cytochrome P450 [Mycolicibacterium sp. BK607]